jgi:hypothetical protein
VGAENHGMVRTRGRWTTAAVWTGDAQSETDSGLVTVALGRAQFGAH